MVMRKRCHFEDECPEGRVYYKASVLSEIPQRVAYPGAYDRYERFVSKHPSPIKVGIHDERVCRDATPDVPADDERALFYGRVLCG